MDQDFNIKVTSEIGALRTVLIHSPDGGINVVAPSKAQDWLYEDIVDVRKMREEHDVFKQMLLAFLDPHTLLEWFRREAAHKRELERQRADESAGRGEYFVTDMHFEGRPDFTKPHHEEFLVSKSVLEVERLLAIILADKEVKDRLIASVSAVEQIDYGTFLKKLDAENMDNKKLAKALITGYIGDTMDAQGHREIQRLFPPIPNLIFTRDIGIVIGDFILLSKTANPARLRESLIAKFIMQHYLFKNNPKNIIEISNDPEYFLLSQEEKDRSRVTIEGGDLMMIAERHLLIGCSERTSAAAINKLIGRLFAESPDGPGDVLDKVTVIMIPKQRGTMHIDTIFTQVQRDVWVLYGPLSELEQQKRAQRNKREVFQDEEVAGERVHIVQYRNVPDAEPEARTINNLNTLLREISRDEFNVKEDDVRFIYSGNNISPFDEREQWTDACNVVALQEGVVLGYDRNYKTAEAFTEHGFAVKAATDILDKLKSLSDNGAKDIDIQSVMRSMLGEKGALILLPSAELSRARGGSHCMTMPVLRDAWQSPTA